MSFEKWDNDSWKVNVRDLDGEKCYDLKAPGVTYVFNEHDLLQLANNINTVAEHIYDKEFYYIHDGNIFKRTGGQLLGVIEDCEELNSLYKENQELKKQLANCKIIYNKAIATIDMRINAYEHRPFSAPISNPANPNYDPDVDRLARLSELQQLKKELRYE